MPSYLHIMNNRMGVTMREAVLLAIIPADVRRIAPCALSVCAVSGAVRVASAQIVSASVREAATAIIAGVVRDSAGRPLTDVSLQIGEVGAKGVSGGDGKYQLRLLPAGALRVIARRLGYLPEAADVTLRPGDSLSLDFDLRAAPQMLPATVIADYSLVPPKYRFTTRFDPFFAHRVTALTPFGALLNIPTSSIELMEVYRGAAEMPIEARGDGCGAVVVYTR